MDLADLFDEDGERLMMLWLEGRSVEAFVELFCRFERQARRLIRKYLRSVLRISARDVDDAWRLSFKFRSHSGFSLYLLTNLLKNLPFKLIYT